MALRRAHTPTTKTIEDFLRGKSETTRGLYEHFINQFKKAGKVTIVPANTMIGIATEKKRVAYITQLGKNFVHVVFPFEVPYPKNLCFIKIAEVPVQPGAKKQFNHHFRMFSNADVNQEVRQFIQLAIEGGS